MRGGGEGPACRGNFPFPHPTRTDLVFRKTYGTGEYDWEKEMDFGWAIIDRQSVGSLAAFILEPILSTGGILVLSKGEI